MNSKNLFLMYFFYRLKWLICSFIFCLTFVATSVSPPYPGFEWISYTISILSFSGAVFLFSKGVQSINNDVCRSSVSNEPSLELTYDEELKFCQTELVFFRSRFFSVILLLVILIMSLWSCQGEQFKKDQEWYTEVRFLIISLRSAPPHNVTQSEWDKAIDRVEELHRGCSNPRYYTDRSKSRVFLQDFRERLSSEIKPEIIEWIWSQYLLFSITSEGYVKEHQYIPKSS